MDLSAFASIGLDGAGLRRLIREHEQGRRPELDKLWAYYRNPVIGAPGVGAPEFACGVLDGGVVAGPGPVRGATQAQALGLPERLRKPAGAGGPGEVVIENDIAWRVDALVDVVFGKPVRIECLSADEALARRIERTLEIVWEASGGLGLMQDLGLLGGVYGYADLLVRADGLLFGDAGVAARRLAKRGDGDALTDDVARAAAEGVRFEPISPARGVPVVDPGDYRSLLGYAVRSVTPGEADAGASAGSEVIEVVSATHRAVYAGGELRWSGRHGLRGVPVVHMQNVGRPFSYAGVSDVEPLIGLQDELNTRLSDRAHRVTMQSFRMYVAKGIEGMGEVPVRPGQVWSTDNTDAEVQAFGGDVYSPSEDEHVTQVREAMDKASGVSPVVLGLLRARIGHLSSENALRVTLMGVLAKAARKRMTYGRGIVAASRMVLAALHDAGVLPTDERDRALRIRWPDPLPVDEGDRLSMALKKVELGVPRERVLEELGYGSTDGGVS